MYAKRETTWIGFQEAQKTINSLKQEVEIAEKKLQNVKKSFNERTAFKPLLKFKKYVPSSKSPEENGKKQPLHFKKETFPTQPKLENVFNEEKTVPKELFITSEEEPNFLPSKLPHAELLDFKKSLIKSSLDSPFRRFSSTDSSSSCDIKQSSSEGTSSLIENTYKVAADSSSKNNETRATKTISDKSSSLVSNDKGIEMPSIEKSVLLNSGDIGMEWRPVLSTNKKAFVLHNKFRPDGLQKLRDIIEQQKKKQEQYQIELERNLTLNFDQPHLENFTSLEDIAFEDKITQVPVRKSCLVKSLPTYKGFSAPTSKLPVRTRWRKQKNKHTMAQSPSFKRNDVNSPKRIKTVVKCESDFVSASYWKSVEKQNLLNEKEKLDQALQDGPLELTSNKELLKDETSENKDENTEKNEENTSSKSSFESTESTSKDKKLLNDKDSSGSDVEDAKEESFSDKADLKAELLKISQTTLNDNSSSKENKKPFKSKSLKRKAKISSDPKVPSPKIRHYDVDKIRDYIKKKKEERKKRHQDEYKKRINEAQRKKEGLEKLYEYHKQNNKSTVKGKPLSPIKILQKKDAQKREHENQNISSISKNKHVSKYSNFQKLSSTEQKEILKPDQKSVEESFLESKDTEASPKNKMKSTENAHIDVSIPNVSQVPAQSLLPEKQSKNKKNSVELNASNENEIKRRKKVTDSNLHMKASLESPVQGSTMNKVTEQNLSLLKSKSEKARNIQESFQISDIFKSISSVSTPSEISHIVGIDAHILELMRPTKLHNTQVKSKKSSELKDLIQSINVMTKPFEPLFRTRKWVEDSPNPPSLKKVIEKESVVLEKKKPSEVPKKKLNFSKSSVSPVKNSSFKEQISGIGEVSQLYARILGKEPSVKPVQSILNEPMFADSSVSFQNNETEDELIEGIIDSDEIEKYKNEENFATSHCSDKMETPDSSKFPDLQKIVPDPFNLINTWNRKPLSLPSNERQVKDIPSNKKGDVPSKLAKNDASFEKLYKNLLDINQVDSEIKSNEHDNSGVTLSSLPNQDTALSSIVQSTKTSVSRKGSLSQSVSRMSNENSVSLAEDFPSASSTSSHSSSNKSKPSLSKISAVEIEVAGKNNVRIKDAEKKLEPLDSYEVSPKKKNLVENFSEEVVIHEQLQQSSSVVDPSAVSDILLSGTIYSEYSVDIEMQSFKEHKEESIKEVAQDKASASGSSVSEVISVVENSKGFKSSTDNFQSSSPKSAIHSSADEKSISEEKLSSKTLSNGSDEVESKLSGAAKNKSSYTYTSRNSEKDSEHSVLVLKNDQLQSIPSGSQNSVTIDFTQPLRLTLSNGESVESDIQENQYLHTQVVTRVASEAAAAAATSAVIAVFETQKALLAEKNIFGVLSSFGRSHNSKRTQYSSDFESSPVPKSSSRSSVSSALESKNTKPIPEHISKETIDEVSSKNESIEEKITEIEENAVFNSSPDSIPKTEESAASVHSELISKENQKTPQRSKRKISGNLSSPSPASLSENESISSETIMSSHSNISLQSESVVSEDSFAQLTLDVVRRMTHEEEQRAKNQLSLLQFQEKTIVENARAEMLLLESFKKKLREKGADKKVSAIKKRQKELITRLRQERVQLQCMQEAYRSICEKHRSLIEDKKKLLKEPSSLAFQLLRDDKPYSAKYSETRQKEYPKATSSSTPTIASDNDIKTMVDEESVSEVPEMLKGLASNSSQESVVETQISEPPKTSNSSQNKSQRNSPNPSFSPLNAAQSNSNPSLHSNNSLETALQGLKKLEASKRHLTKREQRILQRRKQVESLLQWQMKLDSEEMAVRELEQKALDLVDHSKKRAKYYVSSSGSTNQDDDKKKESVFESISEGVPDLTSKLHEKSVSLRSASENKTSKTPSDESIPTHMSENDLEGSGTGSEKESIPQVSSVTHSSKSLPEEIKSESKASSVHTIETTENGSHIEDAISEEILYQGSPSVKDKSSSSEIYSESFESSEKTGKRSPSVLSTSPLKNSSPSSSKIKKSSGLGIRLPLVPRNMRRHDSSGSDDSYTISQSETASDQSDIEVRIHALTEELKRRKAEAEKLKRKKYREQLKEKEFSLQKQLEAYNQFINQTKSELEHQIESAVSPPQAGDLVVKPRIKWPRPEQVVDSRRVRKQPTFSPDNFSTERKSDFMNGNAENSIASVSSDRGKLVQKLFPDTTPRLEEGNNKEISEKSTSDSKDVSEALSANISEIQEVSEIEQLKSVSSEVSSDIKELSDIHENSSIQLQLDESKSSNSDEKKSSFSFLEESKNSPDTAESKSQSDTFITESSSSKSADPTTPKHSDDNFSNNTVSSEDELSTKKAKSISRDDDQKSDVQLSKDISQDSTSSEEIISEVQSIINSLSTAEELEEENSGKISKCNSAQGCELSAKNDILHENVLKMEQFDQSAKLNKEQSNVETDVELTVSSPLEGQKKLLPSESLISNVVNILSTTLIDDTLQTFIHVYNKKCKLQNILDNLTVKLKSTKAKGTKDEKVESISKSLFDMFLKDALDSIFGIMKPPEGYFKQKVLLPFSQTETNNNNLLSSMDISSGSVNNILAKTENSNEYISSHIQDINDSEILNKPAFWNVNNLITSERDQQIQQLEQQLVFQQYSYFYRKIPNKPPPPYTPPSSNAPSVSSFEFPFVKEKPVEKSSVKDVTKHIDEVVDGAIEILIGGKEQGLSITEIVYPAIDNMAVKLDLTMPHQNVFMDLVFDLTKEIILEHFSETKENPQPWLRPRKLTPKPLITSKESMSDLVQKEVKKALKLDSEPYSQTRKKQLSWSSLKLGRKKRDFVDTILISELKEEEPDWVNYDQDEVTVKFQIADSIFNLLINDTVNLCKELRLKTNR